MVSYHKVGNICDTSFVGEKMMTGKPFDEMARFKLDANEYVGL